MALLRESGLEGDACPDCMASDWNFTGNETDGFREVWCPMCGRHYTAMTAAEEYAYHAHVSAAALKRGDATLAARAYYALVNIWNNYERLRNDGRKLVCVIPGTPQDDDDAPPF